MYPTRAICLVGVLVWSAWDHVQSTHARTVAGIEINLESFNHRNIRSNFTICQKIQGSYISFLTKVLNSVGWIWSIIFSNECWHLIHVLLLTVYGTYSKNYMHFEKLYSCYGTATLTKRSQIEANHQSTQNITSHPSEENYIIVKVVTCFYVSIFPLFPVEIPGLVCMYGNGDRPGVFYTPMDGKIYSIKLVHITGKVSCR